MAAAGENNQRIARRLWHGASGGMAWQHNSGVITPYGVARRAHQRENQQSAGGEMARKEKSDASANQAKRQRKMASAAKIMAA
jgi:hypothetical protein